jgi:hypothetical protein
MFLGRIEDTFQIHNRGVLFTLDGKFEQVSERGFLKAGDQIELRLADGKNFRTEVAGVDIEASQRTVAFILPLDVKRDQVQLGADVWKLGESN